MMSLGTLEDMFEFIQWCKAVGLNKRETKELCIKEGYLDSVKTEGFITPEEVPIT